MTYAPLSGSVLRRGTLPTSLVVTLLPALIRGTEHDAQQRRPRLRAMPTCELAGTVGVAGIACRGRRILCRARRFCAQIPSWQSLKVFYGKCEFYVNRKAGGTNPKGQTKSECASLHVSGLTERCSESVRRVSCLTETEIRLTEPDFPTQCPPQ